jgi:hypothetical protein
MRTKTQTCRARRQSICELDQNLEKLARLAKLRSDIGWPNFRQASVHICDRKLVSFAVANCTISPMPLASICPSVALVSFSLSFYPCFPYSAPIASGLRGLSVDQCIKSASGVNDPTTMRSQYPISTARSIVLRLALPYTHHPDTQRAVLRERIQDFVRSRLFATPRRTL